MDWSERMNTAVGYIEDNLTGEIDFGIAAEKAACSIYHFQRVFFAINGLTPADYARRRRLTLAATELSSGNAKVIDVATKYGYDSPNAFARAFRNLHGISPTAARAPGVMLTAFPRISFHIQLIGGNDMDYKILEKPAFDVVAKSERISGEVFGNFVIDPEAWEKFWWDFWEKFKRDNGHESLEKLTGGQPGPVTRADYLGVTNIENRMEGFSYAVGFEKHDTTIPAGYEVIHVPAATWAVFESTGPLPKAIHDIEDRIFQEWFPSTGYEHDAKPELEVYLPGDPSSPDYRCQVWMPIVKKIELESVRASSFNYSP